MTPIAKMLAAALFAAVAGAPAIAQSLTVDYDQTVNFNKFRTYTWDKVHATDPSVEERLVSAANRDLSAHYMTEISSGGEITITAVEATQDKEEFSTFYDGLGDFSWQRPWGSGGFLDNASSVQDIPVDSLVIDMYDTKTHKLLWRGTVAEPVAKSEDKNDQLVDKAVSELIAKYPPKYEKK
jgi:broad specificity polyphosphatase/5'/3'-nucleotidase SurE